MADPLAFGSPLDIDGNSGSHNYHAWSTLAFCQTPKTRMLSKPVFDRAITRDTFHMDIQSAA